MGFSGGVADARALDEVVGGEEVGAGGGAADADRGVERDGVGGRRYGGEDCDERDREFHDGGKCEGNQPGCKD